MMPAMQGSKRVVVTGIGIVSPLGIGAEAHWAALVGGKSGLGPIARFDPGGFDCHVGGQVADYKMGDFVPKSYRKATKLMARDTELAVIAADDAFRSAGLKSRAYADPAEIDGARFGCNIGAGLISAELNELTAAMAEARAGDGSDRLDLEKWGGEGMTHLTPLWLLKYLPNMLSCHVTIVHGLMGPSNTITCGDASGHLAIGEAFRTIQRGKADLAICGGAESKLNPMGMMRQQKLGRLNTHVERRPRVGRPAVRAGRGGERDRRRGRAADPRRIRARPRRAARRCTRSSSASRRRRMPTASPSPTRPAAATATAARNALKDANLTPADVGLLVPHGLGIASHDAAELAGLTAGASVMPGVKFPPPR